MANNFLAIIFALASALTIAWGTVVRHRIALEAANDGSLKGSPVGTAVRRPMWWFATSMALVAYGLQIIALSFGTLLVVQPVLVLSLMFTIPLAARTVQRPVSRSQWLWAGILSASVAVFILLGRPLPGDPHPPAWRWVVGGAVVTAVLLGMLWAARGRPSRRRALLLGLVTGAIFGGVAVLSKAVVDNAIASGWEGVALRWETYALIAGAALGTVVQQYSFNAGPLTQSLPAMTIGEPIVALSMGFFILGERFQVETLVGALIMATAVVVMMVATWKLSVIER